MIAVGPSGAVTGLRSAGEAQPPPDAARDAPSTVSGTAGDAAAATSAETNQAVDPALQTTATDAAPKDESNEQASAARGFVEPARADAQMLIKAEPNEETAAGPPPTFELSILEKTRAFGSEATASAELPVSEAQRPDTADGETLPLPQAEAAKPVAGEPASVDRAEAAPQGNPAPASEAPEPSQSDVQIDPTPRGAPPQEAVPGETA